jgi:hypothetical protein
VQRRVAPARRSCSVTRRGGSLPFLGRGGRRDTGPPQSVRSGACSSRAQYGHPRVAVLHDSLQRHVPARWSRGDRTSVGVLPAPPTRTAGRPRRPDLAPARGAHSRAAPAARPR